MVLLVGDAASIMSSVGGQGVNIASRDRIVATNSLSLRKKHTLSKFRIDDALEALEAKDLNRLYQFNVCNHNHQVSVTHRAVDWGEPARAATKFAKAHVSDHLRAEKSQWTSN